MQRIQRAIQNRLKASFAQPLTTISFTTPFADVFASNKMELRHHDLEAKKAAGRHYSTHSFATPFSDFMSPTHIEMEKPSQLSTALSEEYRMATELSFSSPLSDFTAPTSHEIFLSETVKDSFNPYSYATPFSDFSAPSLAELTEEDAKAALALQRYLEADRKSQFLRGHGASIAFASPFADFSAPNTHDIQTAEARETYLPALSFATPLADFTSPSVHEMYEREYQAHETSLSFAAPYSDFVAHNKTEIEALGKRVIPPTRLSFSAPYADFTASNEQELERIGARKAAPTTKYCFATPNADFLAAHLHEEFDSAPRKYEEAAYLKALDEAAFFSDLPKTLEEAMRHSNHVRQARVITEAMPPFRITYVNDAWVSLCGYSQEEAVGKTMQMLQGAETDNVTLQSIKEKVMKDSSSAFQLVNYRKNGRPFLNKLRIAPLNNRRAGEDIEDAEVTHFLGVLEDISASIKIQNRNQMQSL